MESPNKHANLWYGKDFLQHLCPTKKFLLRSKLEFISFSWYVLCMCVCVFQFLIEPKKKITGIGFMGLTVMLFHIFGECVNEHVTNQRSWVSWQFSVIIVKLNIVLCEQNQYQLVCWCMEFEATLYNLLAEQQLTTQWKLHRFLVLIAVAFIQCINYPRIV